MKVLVTGGAGYIGSTICSALLDAGMTPIILDSLVNGPREFTAGRIFYEGDIADKQLVHKIFKEHPQIEVTIHCAALIVVPESVAQPAHYYRENVAKSLEFFSTLLELKKGNVVFSSSASLYGSSDGSMVTEEATLAPSSPYANTKWMMEILLQDFCNAYDFRSVILRYFNPIGSDPKLRSGIHDPKPSHVLGKLIDASTGILPEFLLTGTQWPTRDGTGIRDFIAVWDLANAHVKAVQNFAACTASKYARNGAVVINLGTGKGVTVKELLNTFESVIGKKVQCRTAEPRPGDVAGAYANADRAKELLNWKADIPIKAAIESSLQWDLKRRNVIAALRNL